MMSKERLEEVSTRVIGLTDSDGDFADEVKMSVDVYEWFYRQAERARVLEAYIDASTYIRRRLRKENKQYRGELKDIRDISTDSVHEMVIRALESDENSE